MGKENNYSKIIRLLVEVSQKSKVKSQKLLFKNNNN